MPSPLSRLLDKFAADAEAHRQAGTPMHLNGCEPALPATPPDPEPEVRAAFVEPDVLPDDPLDLQDEAEDELPAAPDWEEDLQAAPDRFAMLDKAQRHAASSKARVTYVAAGPGAGKTRVIIQRIAALADDGLSAMQIRAATFTIKAAKEMTERLQEQGVAATVGTLHNLSRSLILHCREQIPDLADAGGFVLARKAGFRCWTGSEGQRLMSEIVRKYRLPFIATAAESRNPYSDAASQRKSFARAPRMRYQDAMQLAQQRDKSRQTNWLEVAYALYQQALVERNAYDFDDQVLVSRRLAEACPKETAAFLAPVAHLLVDEFQDTSQVQLRMLQAFLRVAPHLHLYCVGDEDQSIYGFRGADVSNVAALRDENGADVRILPANYRSRPAIVKAAQALIAQNRQRTAKALVATRPDSRAAVQRVQGSIEWQVETLLRGGRPVSDIAVIGRIWKPIQGLAQWAEEQGLPLYCERYAPIAKSAFAKALAAVMRLQQDWELDDATAKRLVKMQGPCQGRGEKFWSEWPHNRGSKVAAPIADWLHAHPYRGDLGLLSFSEAFVKAGFVRALARGQQVRWDKYCARMQSCAAFWQAANEPVDERGITLTTAHGAKGLEWPVVLLLADGFPHGMGPEEEERRLLYVAMTRAQDMLLVHGHSDMLRLNGETYGR